MRIVIILISLLAAAACSAVGSLPTSTRAPARTPAISSPPATTSLPTPPPGLLARLDPLGAQTVRPNGRGVALPGGSRWRIGFDRGATALDPGAFLVEQADRSVSVTVPFPEGSRILYGTTIWLVQNGAATTIAQGSRYLDSNPDQLLLWTLDGSRAELRVIGRAGGEAATLAGSGSIVGAFDGPSVMVADDGRFGRWDPVGGSVAWHDLPADMASPEAIWAAGDRAVIVSVMSQAVLLEASSGRTVARWFAGGSSEIAVDPSGTYVASSSGDAHGILELRRLQDGSVAQRTPESLLTNVDQVAWPSAGLIWYFSAPTGTGSFPTLRLLSTAGGPPAAVATGMTDLAGLGAGRDSLAVLGGDGTLTLFDLSALPR